MPYRKYETTPEYKALMKCIIIGVVVISVGVVGYFLVKHLLKNDSSEFCNPDLCPPGVKHIGCNPPEQFSNACISPKQVQLSYTLISIIVQKHNEMRNELAGGNITNLGPASEMRIVKWNKQLAYLAALNTKRCALQYDECRNTKQFPNVGQNIGLSNPVQSKRPTSAEAITMSSKIIELWFDEFTTVVRPPVYYDGTLPNFANIAHDRTTQIGCGLIAFFTRRKKMVYFLTCNYSHAPERYKRIYSEGKTGLGCQTGSGLEYVNLCGPNE